MGLSDQLNQEYIAAMRAKDERTVSVIRMLKTAIKNQEIEARHTLSEEELHTVVRRLIKQTNDVLVDFERGGRHDLVLQARQEIAQLERYAPKAMEETDIMLVIDAVIQETGARGAGEVGKVMGAVMKKLAGKADGALVRTLALKRLS